MSKSEPEGHDIFLFDDWVIDEYRRSGGFTALIILMRIGSLTVEPLRSTFVHVIGDEIAWVDLSRLLSSSGVQWDGVLLDPVSAEDGGPVEDDQAREMLRALERSVIEDRSVINEGHFFDPWGRRLRIDEVQPQ